MTLSLIICAGVYYIQCVIIAFLTENAIVIVNTIMNFEVFFYY
jgi:hypothetical protein